MLRSFQFTACLNFTARHDLMMPDQGIETGNLPAQFAPLQGIIHMPNYHLKPEIHVCPGKFIPLNPQFRERKVLKRIPQSNSL
jgi:hypothetical protein